MKSFVAACLTTAALSFEMFEVSDKASSWPKMTIYEDGVPKDIYVTMDGNPSGGDTLNVPAGTRGYWSLSPTLDPTQYYKPNLLGGSVEYDVDLS